jgi:hypothetical protein
VSDNRVKHLAAEVALGVAESQELVDGAIAMLDAGTDSPALVELAGLAPSATSQAERLFRRALVELAMSIPSVQDAVMHLARESAAEIVSGIVSPYDGAKRIWHCTLRASERLPELDPFVYAASEWEDRPADRDFFDGAIRNAAVALGDG